MFGVALIALVISMGALGVSVFALVAKRQQDRRDLFLKMHERLIDPDLQKGRRILRERIRSIEDAKHMREHDAEAYQLVGRALAMFDILGCYVLRGYIDEQLVLEEWGRTYAGTWIQGQYFVAERAAEQENTWSAWPHFQTFGEKATDWAKDHPRNSLVDTRHRA